LLALWEGSVTRRGGMMTFVEGETAPRRRKRGDNANWIDVNLTEAKKTHAIDAGAINGQ
jgi:hypothetical protein